MGGPGRPGDAGAPPSGLTPGPGPPRRQPGQYDENTVNATVLVIEDEPDIRQLIRVNLELDGYEVVVAADGAEGLEAVARRRPDAIVLDVMMPTIDGWEVLSRLKASSNDLATVPVLMLTARTDTMDRLRGGIEGAIRYLTKPFSPLQLRDAVRDALTGAPEPVRRRQVQQQTLAELARIEAGQSGSVMSAPDAAHPRLSRLEQTAPIAVRAVPAGLGADQLGQLSPKQRELLEAVGGSPTVSEAAARLEVSRSNVYASLRRIARKLGVRTVSELVHLARAGAS
jgi:CheY-like chemotaxis protein/DNA-binding CsgD family transcriptional regulator